MEQGSCNLLSPFLIPYLPSQHFAHFGLGEHVSEFNIVGNLVRSKSLPTPFREFIGTHTPGIGLEDHKGLYSLSHFFIRNAYHAGRQNRVVFLEHPFDFRCGDSVTLVLDHVDRSIQVEQPVLSHRFGRCPLFCTMSLRRFR